MPPERQPGWLTHAFSGLDFREALFDRVRSLQIEGCGSGDRAEDHAGNWTCMAWANSEARSALRRYPSAMALSRLVVYAAR